ncbi:MAG: hypothetical protein ACRD72_01700 [Candidatus Angelobacter sp.]
MKRLILLAVSLAIFAPVLHAQNHGEAGVFADYFRLQTAPQDFGGIGARISINVHPNIAAEADGAYDFERSRTQLISSGGISSTFRSNFRITHGLFGAKLQWGKKSPVRLFATAKAGFIRFGVNSGPVTFGNATGGTGQYKAALYPGGGVEGFWGWIGLRLDVGDEIYFDRGANHNLKVTLGPHIRF